MTRPFTLLQQYAQALDAEDAVKRDETKSELLELDIDSKDVARAQFRLGLFILNHEKNLAQASSIFKNVFASNIKDDDVAEAGIQLAICLYSENKLAQAAFELRKVISLDESPNPHTAAAWDYLAIMQSALKAPAADIKKTNAARIAQLTALHKSAQDNNDRDQYALRLAAVYQERNLDDDLKNAKVLLDPLAKSTTLDKAIARSAKTLLKQLKAPKRK